MKQNALGKSIYDVVGIVAACSGLIALLYLLIILSFGLFTAQDKPPAMQGSMFWFTLIPFAVNFFAALLISLACRRWSRRCADAMETESSGEFNVQRAFALCGGLSGMILILLVCYRLIDKGNSRLEEGLVVNNTKIPFTHFIDLGVYLILGALLFFRPTLPHALWARFGGGKAA